MTERGIENGEDRDDIILLAYELDDEWLKHMSKKRAAAAAKQKPRGKRR